MQQRTMAARGPGEDAAQGGEPAGADAQVPAEIASSVDAIMQRVHIVQPATGALLCCLVALLHCCVASTLCRTLTYMQMQLC